jgi:hypothetical protein
LDSGIVRALPKKVVEMKCFSEEALAEIVEQAKREERERIARLLGTTTPLCPPGRDKNSVCPAKNCTAHWIVYLEPPKNPEEPAEGAE